MAKTKLMRTIFNCETGELSEREFTAEEYAQKEIDTEKQLAAQAESELKAQAKAALLERLGLTQEEFNTLTA
jgi:hypothetical protein